MAATTLTRPRPPAPSPTRPAPAARKVDSGLAGEDRHVAFTGSQNGMTNLQASAVHTALLRLRDLGVLVFHQGDCIGADEHATSIAAALGFVVVAHPPKNMRKRAWGYYDQILPPAEYLARNHDMVEACGWLLATPATGQHLLRSGTWATVRYAIRRNRRLSIFGPDGLLIDPTRIGDPQRQVAR